jgi:hypothetical protein
MPTSTSAAGARIVFPPERQPGRYIALTAVGAAIAAIAAFVSLSLGLAPWIMFMGWVAYYTRPTLSEGWQTYACVAVGIGLGAVATITATALAPLLGPAALPAVVFAIACIVIATRGLAVMNNLLGYFIGLITFFAAHQDASAATIGMLAVAIAIGFAAGIASQHVQSIIAGPPPRTAAEKTPRPHR